MLLDLFLTFAQIGLFTFGGGYAMISLIENACVERKHWITHDDMMNITVIAESTPDPIAVNCATFVGLSPKGPFWCSGGYAGADPAFLRHHLCGLRVSGFLSRDNVDRERVQGHPDRGGDIDRGRGGEHDPEDEEKAAFVRDPRVFFCCDALRQRVFPEVLLRQPDAFSRGGQPDRLSDSERLVRERR